jgi:hypothetical protein
MVREETDKLIELQRTRAPQWNPQGSLQVAAWGHGVGAALAAMVTVGGVGSVTAAMGAMSPSAQVIQDIAATSPAPTAAATAAAATTSGAEAPSSSLAYPVVALSMVMPSFGFAPDLTTGAANASSGTVDDLDRCTQGNQADSECAKIWADLIGLREVREQVGILVGVGVEPKTLRVPGLT